MSHLLFQSNVSPTVSVKRLTYCFSQMSHLLFQSNVSPTVSAKCLTYCFWDRRMKMGWRTDRQWLVARDLKTSEKNIKWRKAEHRWWYLGCLEPLQFCVKYTDFRNQSYVSDGNTYTLESKAHFIKRHNQVSVLVECYAMSLVNWFLALRGEILVSSSSIEVLKNRLYHFHGLCIIKFLIGMNRKLEKRGRKLSWPLRKVCKVCRRPITLVGSTTKSGC